jgi:diamine N-acetyltransferase
MKIPGSKIYLRLPIESDADDLLRWENDPEVWDAGDNKEAYSRRDVEDYLALGQDLDVNLQMRLMICHYQNDRNLGCIDLYEYDPDNKRAGVGILIYEKKDRNLGFASEALKLLIHYSKMELKLHQLFCHILSENIDSLLLFRNVGFQDVGLKKEWRYVNNKWQDEFMFQLLLNE